MKISVLGAGAWGTALAMHIAKRHHVTLWARDASHISGMQKARSNPKYLGDFNFPKQLSLEDNLSIAVNNSDFILSVVPTSAFRQMLIDIKEINSNIVLFIVNYF